MKRIFLIIALIFSSLIVNATGTNCAQLSEAWKSKKKAVESIESTAFNVSDTAVPNYKSWLVSAHFYSCDGEIGYLIIKGNKKTFLHQNVPMAVWQSLKNAKSMGGYYNFYIRNRYQLEKGSFRVPIP